VTPRTRTQPRSTPLRTPRPAAGLSLAIALLVGLRLAPALEVGPFIPRLTVDNPTPFAVNLQVAGPPGQGSSDVGTVGRETQDVVEQVLDAGDRWVFRFSYGGVDAGEVELSRAVLRAAGWRLSVPPEVAGRLAAAGLTPSAR
jgi:hypothetical protein